MNNVAGSHVFSTLNLVKSLSRCFGLQNAGLTLTVNPLKSVFGQEKVKFLVHRVSTSGIRLLPSQVEAVVAFQHPSTHA